MIYLFAGYAVIWALLCGYALHIARGQRKVQAQVEALRRALEHQP